MFWALFATFFALMFWSFSGTCHYFCDLILFYSNLFGFVLLWHLYAHLIYKKLLDQISLSNLLRSFCNLSFFGTYFPELVRNLSLFLGPYPSTNWAFLNFSFLHTFMNFYSTVEVLSHIPEIPFNQAYQQFCTTLNFPRVIFVQSSQAELLLYAKNQDSLYVIPMRYYTRQWESYSIGCN